jgi:hypothetical protein
MRHIRLRVQFSVNGSVHRNGGLSGGAGQSVRLAHHVQLVNVIRFNTVSVKAHWKGGR